jgi:hypothetical protein
MSALDDRRRLEELYLPPADEFVLVDVPDLQFVMIDGEGNLSGEAFAQASRWLFSVVFPIKRVAKERMGKSFVEPPLEGLWWADDMNDLIAGNRDKLKWRLMIVTGGLGRRGVVRPGDGQSVGTARGAAAQSEARAVRRRDECADHACRPQ